VRAVLSSGRPPVVGAGAAVPRTSPLPVPAAPRTSPLVVPAPNGRQKVCSALQKRLVVELGGLDPVECGGCAARSKPIGIQPTLK
jgi:hypothetical protein